MSHPPSDRRRNLIAALAFLLTALAVNAASVGLGANRLHLSADQELVSASRRMLVLGGQIVCAGIGVVLLLGLVRLPRVLSALATLVLLVVSAFGLFWTGQSMGYFIPKLARLQMAELERLNASESVHLKLTPRFSKLNTSGKNLRVPSGGDEQLFTDEVRVVDLAKRNDQPDEVLPTVDAKVYHWDVEGNEHVVERADLDLMRPLFDDLDYVEHCSFGFVRGDFLQKDDGYDYTHWRVASVFKGVGRLKSGEVGKFSGNLHVTWSLAPGSNPMDPEQLNDPERWFISEIHFDDFKVVTSPFKYFDEVLDDVVSDPAAVAEARTNHTRRRLEKMLLEYVKSGEKTWAAPHDFWDYRGAWIMPSAAIVDVDGDGWDDFYALEQEGDPQFFHNQGDGTFVEDAAERGLKIGGTTEVGSTTNSALFADFDNDGDPDLFLARSLERSKYLLNEDGKFQDATDRFQGGDVYFGSTASAADYDMDGLLDVYVGTYAAQAMAKEFNRAAKGIIKEKALLAHYLPPEEARKLYDLAFHGMENHIRDRVGPPNRLMHNEGAGSFAVVEDTPLTLYRNTFQSTWADVDEDGDPDVYAANDFALNNFFRNEGNGTFVDATKETDSGDVGFGMGASYGDFDADGDEDLYVSNMFSKAGSRILDRVTGIDPRFKDMAAGNSLLAWTGNRFEKVSSKSGPGMHVEVGGWSWGSQFLDVDNDGWLDLYTLNGFYSAPSFFKEDVDL